MSTSGRERGPTSPKAATESIRTNRPQELSAELPAAVPADQPRARFRKGKRLSADGGLQAVPATLDVSPRRDAILPTLDPRTGFRPRYAGEGEHPDPSVEMLRAEAASGSDNYPVIAGYEVLGELGRGGMGVVYKARQLGLNRVVALKMVLGGPFAEPEFRSRFRIEAEAIARLQHPNIVQVYAVGTQDSPLGESFSCPFFALEYMDGGTLAGRHNGTPQPAGDAAKFVETLARAVHFAHEHGIVHRDLKPANILLRGGGDSGPVTTTGDTMRLAPAVLADFEPKISDFGLAKQLDSADGSPTVTGIVVGTPEYMAPEQAVGDVPIGPAVDVYALGVILYELITGRRPFQGATPLETLEMAQAQDPVTPRRLQPKVPRDLETICLKCLEKQPQKRYASALAFADDLRRYREGETIQARPVGRPERAWRWAKRRPTVAALVAAVVFTALGGVAGITVAWLHAQAGWAEADKNREAAESREAEAETNLYFSRIAQARLGNPLAAGQLLDRYLPRGNGIPDRRGWEWHYLKGVLNADLLTIPSAHDSHVYDLHFSRDGQRLLTAGGSPFNPKPPDQVCIWQVWGPTAGTCLRKFPHPIYIFKATYVDDDRQVAWAGDDDVIHVAEVESGRILVTRSLPKGYHRAIFSADGRRYAALGDNGQARVWDLMSGQEAFAAQIATQTKSLSFSPDGKHLVICGGDVVRLWDIAAARELRVLPHPQSKDSRSQPTFSPDGRYVAHSTSQSGLVRVWDTTTGELIHTLAGHTGSVMAVAFDPTCKHFATAGVDGTVRLWSAQTGAEVLQLHGHQGRVGSLTFHPSGRYLASGGEQPADIKVWDLTRHQEYISVKTEGRIDATGFSADGAVVHAIRHLGVLQTADAGTGVELDAKPVAVMGGPTSPATVAVFSRDGRRVVVPERNQPWIAKIVDVNTAQVLHRLEHDVQVLHVAFSGDSRRLATAAVGWRPTDDKYGRREVYVWDVETGRRMADVSCDPYQPGRGTYGVVALDADGRRLAYDEYAPKPGSTDKEEFVGRVRIRALDTGEVQEVAGGFRTKIFHLAFSANGQHLAITSGDTGVFLCDWADGGWRRRPRLAGSDSDTFYNAAFSPDGKRLAAVSRGQVFMWDVATGQAVLDLRGAPPRASDMQFNPQVVWSQDGRRLAASNQNNSVSIWDTADRQTLAAKQAMYRAAEARTPWP